MKRTLKDGAGDPVARVVYTPEPVRKLRRESALKPGDHVLFPHWAGVPIEGYSRKHYRVVKEEGWKETQDGGIFAHVEYTPANTTPEEELKKLLIADQLLVMFVRMREADIDSLVELISKRFLLIDRDAKSITLSGR